MSTALVRQEQPARERSVAAQGGPSVQQVTSSRSLRRDIVCPHLRCRTERLQSSKMRELSQPRRTARSLDDDPYNLLLSLLQHGFRDTHFPEKVTRLRFMRLREAVAGSAHMLAHLLGDDGAPVGAFSNTNSWIG